MSSEGKNIKSYGTILTDNTSVKDTALKFRSANIAYNFTLPKTFDGQDVWRYYLSPITYQGYCGNCWAESTVTMLADRYSILSKNYIKPYLSPIQVTLCDGIISDRPESDPDSISEKNITEHTKSSCFGNTIINALKFLYAYGAITVDCLNYGYLLEKKINIQLSKFQAVSDLPSCQSIIGNDFNSCVSDISLAARYFRAATFYKLDEDVEQIKKDIFKWGPVVSGFIVYDDFINDYDGTTVYMGPKKDAKPTGGHAIKVVGWGEEKVGEETIQYWLIANSWGRDWGNDGYFRMKIGIPECQLEKNFAAALPDIPNLENPYLGELQVTDANIILQRTKFPVDQLTGYLKTALDQIKNGKLFGILEPLFPKSLSYDLKKFNAGEVSLFPPVYVTEDTLKIKSKSNPIPIYIVLFLFALLLSLIVSILIFRKK